MLHFLRKTEQILSYPSDYEKCRLEQFILRQNLFPTASASNSLRDGIYLFYNTLSEIGLIQSGYKTLGKSTRSVFSCFLISLELSRLVKTSCIENLITYQFHSSFVFKRFDIKGENICLGYRCIQGACDIRQ